MAKMKTIDLEQRKDGRYCHAGLRPDPQFIAFSLRGLLYRYQLRPPTKKSDTV